MSDDLSKPMPKEVAVAIQMRSIREDIEHGRLDEYLEPLTKSIQFRQSQLQSWR